MGPHFSSTICSTSASLFSLVIIPELNELSPPNPDEMFKILNLVIQQRVLAITHRELGLHRRKFHKQP